jgi:hypothetical protein
MRKLTRAHALLLALLAAGAGSCSVGDGVGQVRGSLHARVCEIDTEGYTMEPDFFGGDWYTGNYTVHIARGGDTGEYNDELVFQFEDTQYIAERIARGQRRFEVGPAGTAKVHAMLRLTKSCGRREVVRMTPNVALEAYAGYVEIQSIYRGSPTAEPQDRLTEVSAFSILLRDPRPVRDFAVVEDRPASQGQEPPVFVDATGQPELNRAELEGFFRFYFSRGRPAQRFQ